MKVLYAIQGTGNGHISRSTEIIKSLKKNADVDILISGSHNEIKLPFNVHFNYRGLGFVFGQNGGMDFLKTIQKISPYSVYKEVNQLPIRNYQLVVNDFEPISNWAASKAGIPCISVSNQAASLHPSLKSKSILPSFNRFFLNHYAYSDHRIGLHFEALDDSIETPVIRNEIRSLHPSDDGFGLVYLPFYSDKIILKVLQSAKMMDWVVFSKHSKNTYKIGRVTFKPVCGSAFINYLVKCNTVISAAGFGTTSEALFLGKKLMVVPMEGQFEQEFNAKILKKMGVSVMHSFKTPHAHEDLLKGLLNKHPIKVNYPDNADTIAKKVMKLYTSIEFEKEKVKYFQELNSIKYILDHSEIPNESRFSM